MRFKWQSATVILAAVAVILASTALGIVIGARTNPTPSLPGMPAAWNSANWDTSSRGRAVSLATGMIEGGVEGLFALDHLTGRLYCWVLNPQTGQVGAAYETDVKADLNVGDGELDLVMVTGLMDFSFGRSTNAEPAHSVVYVAEGNSGKLLAYTLLYSREQANLGGVQGGQLQLIAQGQTRAANARRDQD
jgi:hypothetical protein